MALVHKHLIIHARINKPPKSTEIHDVTKWFKDLVTKIGMKILDGPRVVYSDIEGNRGLTGACIIETSHCVMHIWDEDSPGLLQLDVYTCGPLDPYDVVEHLECFEPVHPLQMKYLDREHGLIELPIERNDV